MNARTIVAELLGGDERGIARQLLEATVHLPPRGHRWVAVYTGVEPGKQVWRSTGLTNRKAALAQAEKWEAEAKRQRAALVLKPARPLLRVRRREVGASSSVTSEVGPLSQREVALILKISERAVRAIERRALEKLRRHPKLRALWAELSDQDRVDEPNLAEKLDAELTPPEIAALFGLVRTAEEQQALENLLAWLVSYEP